MADVATLDPDQPVPATPPVRPRRTQENLLILVAFVVVVAALFLAREVLVPVTLAVLLSFVLAPLVGLLRRLRLPRGVAVLLSVVSALVVILALGGLIGTQLSALAGQLPQYQSAIHAKIEALRGISIQPLDALLARLRIDLLGGAAPAGQAATGAPDAGGTISMLGLASWISPVLSPLATMAIVLILAIFILVQKEDVRDRLIRLFGSGDMQRTTLAMNDAGERLSRYFLTLLVVNAATGTIIGLGLFAIGVPSPILWGLLTALLRFVPYVGTTIAALLTTAVAAAVGPGWAMMAWTLALFVIVETVIGQVVEPLVYGRNTGLSPLAVVVAALFWIWLWGGIGLLLSTPLTVCLVVLGRHVEQLSFLDVLFGDRPALLPEENFYQRMLADDPDEASESAEEVLKTSSLADYYDDIALKGLRLAAFDARRGTLTAEQTGRIKQTIRQLVSDLGELERPDPDAAAETTTGAVAGAPDWPDDAVVLCISGRGPLDEAVTLMLAQLLERHGLKTRQLSHDAVSRMMVRALDTAGVRLVCVSYLELADSPPQLRYLLQRLRQRLPSTPIVVGLWPADRRAPPSAQIGTLAGGGCVTSLRDAVDACLRVASAAESRAA